MGMKLLTKSDITKKKSAERKLDIDEGIKLAKKIDDLRELSVSEEKSLEEFRTGTLETIQGEIDKKITERDTLLPEVVRLEKRKEKALAPLTKEKEEIEESLSALEEEKENVQALIQENNEVSIQARRAKSEATIMTTKAEEIQELAQDTYNHTSNLNAEASISRQNAIKTLDKAELYAQGIIDGLNERESELKDKEDEFKKTQESQEVQDKDLKRREILLKDRQDMLLRDVKRLQ